MTPCKQCQDKDAALAEERMYNTRQSAEIAELKMKLAQAEERINIAQDALLWAMEMFVARDEMNAKVHCAPLRLSPITERVAQAFKALSGKEE